jgi:hypothetical protein
MAVREVRVCMSWRSVSVAIGPRQPRRARPRQASRRQCRDSALRPDTVLVDQPDSGGSVLSRMNRACGSYGVLSVAAEGHGRRGRARMNRRGRRRPRRCTCHHGLSCCSPLALRSSFASHSIARSSCSSLDADIPWIGLTAPPSGSMTHGGATIIMASQPREVRRRPIVGGT